MNASALDRQMAATQWKEQLAQLRSRWDALGERERAALSLAGWAVALLLIWMIGVMWAWRTLSQTPAQLEIVERQLQEMQALAAEARELRALPAVPAAQALQALQGASEHLGTAARLTVTGDRATLALNGVGSDALQAWLGEVRNAARARPIEAQLQRGQRGFTGTITLALSGATP